MMKPLNCAPIRLPAFSALLLLLLVGCSTRQQNLAQLPPDDLYARAVAEFEAGRWDRAITLAEFFVAQYIGDPRAPEARIMLGEAHLARREYATAATHFQRLVSDFPSHPRALESRFRICDAYYRLSPRPALDQEYTESALQHCRSVAEGFPGSTEAIQAQERIDELRDKLAQKRFDNGMFYFRRGAFDSAGVYFAEVVEQFPDTDVAPAALSQLAETYDRIGYVEDAEEARERLLQEYPQSPEAQALRA